VNDQRWITNSKTNQSNHTEKANLYLCIVVERISDKENDIWSSESKSTYDAIDTESYNYWRRENYARCRWRWKRRQWDKWKRVIKVVANNTKSQRLENIVENIKRKSFRIKFIESEIFTLMFKNFRELRRRRVCSNDIMIEWRKFVIWKWSERR
jgi:hypothetical protein